MVLIPEGDESKHFLIMGDTGSGKSALIRQMLMQLTEDRQTAIVYDPARHVTRRHPWPQLQLFIRQHVPVERHDGFEPQHDRQQRQL
jgi:type II secretory pathway predicted ATPase ExeA